MGVRDANKSRRHGDAEFGSQAAWGVRLAAEVDFEIFRGMEARGPFAHVTGVGTCVYAGETSSDSGEVLCGVRACGDGIEARRDQGDTLILVHGDWALDCVLAEPLGQSVHAQKRSKHLLGGFVQFNGQVAWGRAVEVSTFEGVEEEEASARHSALVRGSAARAAAVHPARRCSTAHRHRVCYQAPGAAGRLP